MQGAGVRREKILKLLDKADKPLSASFLAEKFSVSRQIIVGDVALLRAEGNKIDSTPRGYMMNLGDGGIQWQIACRHSSKDMQRELYAIVDEGCVVKDVIVDHPVYGQLTGELQIASRHDVDQFIERVSESDALPLSFLTDGIHLHTIICPGEEAYQRVINRLEELGVLL